MHVRNGWEDRNQCLGKRIPTSLVAARYGLIDAVKVGGGQGHGPRMDVGALIAQTHPSSLRMGRQG